MNFIRGRFHKAANKSVTEYTASIPFDRRLYRHDIAGSIAHAKMLAKQGIISEEEAEIIISGLASIREEIEQGKFQVKPELEDIHMSIEARLVSYAMERGKSFSELSLSEYKGFSPLFGEDVYSVTVESSIAARDVIGGTAPKQVDQALATAKKLLGESKG